VSAADLARQAAARIKDLTGGATHSVALVMGSGWLAAADALGEPTTEIPLADLPGFAAPVVSGHGGTLRSVPIDGSNHHALVFCGRTHLYEGRGTDAVVHAVRTASAAGVRAIVLTNGCGGLDRSWSAGTPVVIRDHINLTGASPLDGATFIDLTDLYTPRLRELVRSVDPSIDEGVYVQFRGPQYETPAEIAMVGALGGSLVGMSTALEAIAAREAGLEVLGLSLVTNLAAGISPTPLNHAEVLEAGKRAAHRAGRLLAAVVPRI
jgi:purine-nucleoside phosphorylase